MALSLPFFRGQPLSVRNLAVGVLALTTLGGCAYDGGIYGASDYASGNACSDGYYNGDPYGYDEGYGYGCYDSGDYRSGFANIGFGGGWYDDFYYPGYGTWMYDRYQVRRPLSGYHLNYWGGRRAYYRHHNGRPDRFQGRPTRPAPDYAPNRPSRRPDGVARPDRSDRPDRPNRPNWTGRPNGQDRDAVGTRPERVAPSTPPRRDVTPPSSQARPDGQSRPDRQTRPDRQARPARQTRPERQVRQDGQARPDRQSRPERQARPETQGRPERFARPRNDDR